MEEKVCFACKVSRPLTDFYKDRSRADGLQPRCKICCKHYEETNKQRILARAKVYYRTHGAIGRKPNHYLSNTPEHKVWRNIFWRCTSPAYRWYHRYGGRGIKICERWLKFENFLADMGPRPGPGYTIERKDNDKDYTPGNCCWATQKEQQRNRGNNRRLTLGDRTQVLAAWAEEVGLLPATLLRRLEKGWSVERALMTPVGPQGRRTKTVTT
jgi:hypothetical protein